jgi:hypothetical protein
MSRSAPLALGLALLVLAAAAAPQKALGAVSARPWLLSGPLGAPLPGPVDDGAAVAAARSAIAVQFPWSSGVHLELVGIAPRGDGTRVVRFGQTVSGIPVLDRGARALVEANGAITLATAVLDERITGAVSTFAPTFVIDATTAAKTAARRTGWAFDATRARRVLVSRPDGLHATWQLLASVPIELPTRPLVHVDASTGAITLLVDRTRSAKQLHAFAQNPIKTPSLGTFTLSSLADGATTLDTKTVMARSCVDKSTVKKISAFDTPRDMHVCDVLSAAVADSSGDFLYSRPLSDSAIDDPFSETSLAFHTDKGLRFFADLGLSSLRKEATPLVVIANLRYPPGFNSPSASTLACAKCALQVLDNAFFAPAGEADGALFGEPGDALYFGQGALYDFSYDGDVVYHELTHAVVHSTAKLADKLHIDAQGAIASAPALNEGLADYFSSALTGDGDVGEYASGGAGIRHLDDVETCPARLSNEPHFDSVPFSGAMWTVRKSLDPATQHSFDRGVLLALEVLPSGDVGFEDLTAAIVAGVAKEAGDVPSKTLAATFAKRGLSPCERVRDVGLGAKSPYEAFISYGTTTTDGAFADAVVPGVLQFHQTLPAGTTSILVSLDTGDVASSPRWAPQVPWNGVLLVKFGGPIRWSLTGTTWTGDPSTGRPLSPGAGYANESFPVPPGTTDVYVVVGAKGEGNGYYDNITIEPTVKPLVDAGPPDTGASDAHPDTGSPPDAGVDARDPDGGLDELDVVNGRVCGCRMVGSVRGDARWLLVGLALVAVVLTRRVRTGAFLEERRRDRSRRRTSPWGSAGSSGRRATARRAARG